MSVATHIIESIRRSAGRKQIGPIGIDFAQQEMHLVQLEKQGHDVSLRAHVSMPYPEGRDNLLDSSKHLKGLWKKAQKLGSFSGNKVVTVLPADKVRIMSITYPHNNTMEASQSIIKVLQNRLSSDLSEYVIDYLPVRGNEKDSNYLAIVAIARRVDVMQYLNQLRHAGLNIEALEIGPSAIKRLVTSLVGLDRTKNVMVINFGQKMSYLTILSGRRLMFDQEVESGEELILDRVSTTLDMSIDESRKLLYRYGISAGQVGREDSINIDTDIAHSLREIVTPLFMSLVEEINRVLIYTASETRGEPVSKIYLVGSISRWKGAEELLHSILDIDVETIPNPLTPFIGASDKDSADLNRGSPELAIATGLALRGVADE